MEKRLIDALNGTGENYILPFFWQHGEEEALLCEGMERIRESGIRAVCVESRPHPDFLGDTWWRDMDIIMRKEKELGMRVWVLDDAHFPSGYCNGQVGEDSPYGKTYLTHYCVDAVGPLKNCSFMIHLEQGEELVGVTLGKRDREKPFRMTDIQDMTENVAAGRVFADIPEGTWCVTVIKTTRKGTGRKNYISTIDRAAVRFFIDTVYEAHYARYSEDFGGTFAGFFSDEPEIGNCLGEYRHDAHIGQPDMRLPWSKEVEAALREAWGASFVKNLISLWMDTDEKQNAGQADSEDRYRFGEQAAEICRTNRTGLFRCQFMDLISRLYGENFCMQIGDWCREHGVEYIGHVIEDGGSHAHLGLGTGHFFRALGGQDMSGIDVVLQQIRPQLDDCPFYSIGGTSFYHGELFHYGLAKMGVSLGHLDEKKKGRTMCEVFGAYGWSEGLKLMKWLMDHMLVNGVNYYVPHAFTMKTFPDPDCPPHFYARGMNPQFPYFRYLMEYCNRVSHLIQGGRHVPCAALLYTAEQEWMGSYRPFEKDAKILTRNQIDFDVLPADYLLSVGVENGKLRWGNEEVSVLIVPGSQCIRENLADWIDEAAKQGLAVIFTEQIPQVLGEDGTLAVRWGAVSCGDIPCKGVSCGPVMKKQEELAEYLRTMGCFELKTEGEEPWLRYYHYEQENGGFWLFFTESVTERTDTVVFFQGKKPEHACWYDPWTNQLKLCQWTADGGLKLNLSPYEMQILYTGEVEAAFAGEAADVFAGNAADVFAGGAADAFAGNAADSFGGEAADVFAGSAADVFAGGAADAFAGNAADSFAGEMANVFADETAGVSSGEMEVGWTQRKNGKEQKQVICLDAGAWSLSTKEAGTSEEISQTGFAAPGDISLPDRMPDFSGTMYYRTVFDAAADWKCGLNLGEVYETAAVRVNGTLAGVRIAPPYQFELTGLLRDGTNELEIEVVNTLVNRQRDFMSMTMPMEPSGLIGPVELIHSTGNQ